MTECLQAVEKQLKKRGFSVRVFATAEEATEYLCAALQGVTVGIGGSVTVKEMGLFPRLCAHSEVWWHNDEGQLQAFGDEEIRRRAGGAKAYISSVNGLSADGRLVNIDGRGNRLASTLYGHEKVYFVIGRNKLAGSLEEAIWRARNIAAPKNARRLGLNTPCALRGDKCYNCNSHARICRGILVLEAPTNGQPTEVVLIDEDLGY